MMKLGTVSNKIYLCSIALFVTVLQRDPIMPQDLLNIHQYRGHIKPMATSLPLPCQLRET